MNHLPEGRGSGWSAVVAVIVASVLAACAAPVEENVPEPPPQEVAPGPNEPSDALVIEGVELGWEPGTSDPLVASLTVRNVGDTSRSFLLPRVGPRVEVEDEGVRLSYLRVAFDPDGRELRRPQVPSSSGTSVARGGSYTADVPLPVAGELLTERIEVCVEVMPRPNPGSPAEDEETGVERDGVPPRYDLPEGQDPATTPVPVACSGWLDVPPEPDGS